MERIDFDTFCLLLDFIEEAATLYSEEELYKRARHYRESLGVTRETIVPYEYGPDLLEYRKLEYSPDDWGKDGKFSEVKERVLQFVAQKKNFRWIEMSAHKAGNADLKYGRRHVEKKTGGGSWLVSKKAHTIEGIVNEYRRKKTLLHFENEKYHLDITCQWCEFIEYLDNYKRSKKGPAMGAEYWFKEVIQSQDGDRWIAVMQEWKHSEKKVAYLQKCMFNRAK